MDGTLVDSEPLWATATFDMSERLGRRLSMEKREETIGGSFANTYRICCEHAGVTPTKKGAAEQQQLMFAQIRQLFAEQLDFAPGVRELLAELHSAGVPMIITTNTPRSIVGPALDKLGADYFVDTICGDEVPTMKPAPDMYLEASKRVGKNPGECLVFEDSHTGMRAAWDAGCRLVGLPHSPEVPVPDGASTIQHLRGIGHQEENFAGVSAADVAKWYHQTAR